MFAAIAQQKSFAAAARDMSVSPPVATRMLADLEAELGVQLLVRTTRQVSLTSAGTRFLDAIIPALAQLHEAEAMARQNQANLVGDLKVNAPLSFGQRFLATAVNRFRVLHSGVRLNLTLTDEMIDIVAADADMALRISEPPRDKSTIRRKICKVPRILAGAPSYLVQHGTPQTAADLKDHSLLGYSTSREAQVWRLTSGDADVTVSSFCFECNNGEVLAELATLGEGIVMLPEFILKAEIAKGSLVKILPDWKPPQLWLTATYPPYSVLPAKVSAFTSFIEDAIGPELLSV